MASWRCLQYVWEDKKLSRWRRLEDVLEINKCLLGKVLNIFLLPFWEVCEVLIIFSKYTLYLAVEVISIFPGRIRVSGNWILAYFCRQWLHKFHVICYPFCVLLLPLLWLGPTLFLKKTILLLTYNTLQRHMKNPVKHLR